MWEEATNYNDINIMAKYRKGLIITSRCGPSLIITVLQKDFWRKKEVCLRYLYIK